MNKLKLFSKTYIFTMGIISVIILISNVLIYLALPKVYVNNKQKEADKIIEALIEQVSKSDNEESFKIAKNFAEKYNIQVLLTIGEEKKVFQGSHKVDIYVNKEGITEDSLIIPNLSGENNKIEHKNLIIDTESRQVYVDKQEVILTAREFSILELLMKNPHKVFTRANLFESVWHDEFLGDDNTVNVHISNLRAKLSKADKNTEYIKTVWGIGFKLNDV